VAGVQVVVQPERLEPIEGVAYETSHCRADRSCSFEICRLDHSPVCRCQWAGPGLRYPNASRIPRLEGDLRGSEEGSLKSLGAVLGNDEAIKAYRDRKLPFRDGTIIAACTTATFRPRKITRSSAVPNRSSPAIPRIHSSW
jgi:hypothetical protein